MYSVNYTDRAVKSLKKIPRQWQRRIVKAIDGLKNNPYEGKKLQRDLFGLYSLRVWPYRVIYAIEKEKVVIIVLDIGHRQGVYKK